MGGILHGTLKTVPGSTRRRSATSKIFQEETGRVADLISKDDPGNLLRAKKAGQPVKIGSYTVPPDCFDVVEEEVKETGTRILPHVIEPSFGVERLLYTTLEYNLTM